MQATQTMYYKPRLCNIFYAFLLKYFSSCAAGFIIESLPVVGFSPHVDTTGVFGIAHDHT